MRKEAQIWIGEIFIIYPYTGKFSNDSSYEEFNGIYNFSNSDIFPTLKNRSNILHYSGIIYKNLIFTKLSINFTLFRACFINYKKYQDYIMNKLDFK